MTEHDKRLAKGALLRAHGTDAVSAVRPRHPLAVRFRAERLDRSHLHPLRERATGTLPLAVTLATLERVYDHDPRSFWSLSRSGDIEDRPPAGVTALLLLSEVGLARLLGGTLDCDDPQPEALCAPGVAPAAIYVWLIFAPGPVSGALFTLFDHMNRPPFAGADIYSRPATVSGDRLTRHFGFVRAGAAAGVDNLFVLRRGPRDAQTGCREAATAAGVTETRPITVQVARSLDDIMRAVAIRAVVYMAEQECPYHEEFDGNDLTATHLVAHLGEEPAGCLRLRWFGDFAKIERVAVRKCFRHTRVVIHLVNAALELCRRKGYRQVYGQVQERLVGFWRRFGAKPLPNRERFVFSDHAYVEMRIDLAPGDDAIALAADPHLFNRPEGDWDRPGILERSMARGVNASLHPSGDRRRDGDRRMTAA